jgi:tetratricopeptide (TPR) repeat protein
MNLSSHFFSKHQITIAIRLAALLFLTQLSFVSASSFEDELLTLQHRWAKVNYNKNEDQKLTQFVVLIDQSTAFTEAYPNKAEAWIWDGIIKSSYAGAKGGLGALSFAKEAKRSLEKSLKLDKNALAGSAYTSLGTLYHNVPGWPIGFGDDDEAKQFFEKSLKINPNGIDPNYFYAQYLFDEGEYKQAKQVLLNAQKAAKRPTRRFADKNRQQEISALLKEVNEAL